MVCFLIAFITVQQVCALAALTVRKHKREGKNPIGKADLEWIFARNCEGTEQLQKFCEINRQTMNAHGYGNLCLDHPVLHHAMLPQQLSNLCPVHFFHQLPFQVLQWSWQMHFQWGSSVHQLHRTV